MDKIKMVMFYQEDYTCVKCKNRRVIIRKSKREIGHRKHMFCSSCKRKTIHLNSITGSENIEKKCRKCSSRNNLYLYIHKQEHLYFCKKCYKTEIINIDTSDNK